ncbi:MAG: hypothetical protein ACLUOI_17370 [Eisenbergiella sp.]
MLMDDDCGFPDMAWRRALIDSEGRLVCHAVPGQGRFRTIPFLMPARWEEDWPILEWTQEEGRARAGSFRAFPGAFALIRPGCLLSKTAFAMGNIWRFLAVEP